ncbi:HEAT repeat domain-containing protein [Variovorax sp. ZT5P49]|uniref:HEAT repeat domain-containing protein n=1 Tax=Variovorax sp. ZT5P49 TaxID=3443733 RepID=UPI003F4535BB
MFSLDASNKETISEHFKRNKSFSWSEQFFLSAIDTAKSKHDVFWAVIALRDCGTQQSVPTLKTLSEYPKQDVRDSAILTIAQIAGAAETPYFVQTLEDPLSGRNKVYALWAIGVTGDERALASVEQYVRKNKKKLQAKDVDPRPQQEVLAFLYRVDASSLLREFSFLIPPLDSLTPFALHNFVQRVPGMRVSIEAELGKVVPAEIPKNDSSVA